MSRKRRYAFSAVILSVLAGPSLALGQDGIEQWRLVEELRIGAVDGPQALSGGPTGFVVSPDGGHVYVGQRNEATIRVFDARTGSAVRRIGRSGAGPGEFTSLTGLGWRHDTLYATDSRLQRIAMFSAEGRHLRSIRVESDPIPGNFRPAFASAMCADGTLIGSTFSSSRDTRAPTVQMTREGRVLRTLADPPTRDSWFTIEIDGRFITGVRPFAATTQVTIAPDGCSVVVVHQPRRESSDARFEVLRIRITGDTVYHKRFIYAPRPFPKATIDSVATLFGKGFGSAGESPRVRARILEALDLPTTQAPVSETLIGSDGSTLLRRDDGTGLVNWAVLDETGSQVANLRVSSGLRLLAWDGRALWGRVLDDLDVPYIVRYRVLRAPSR